MNPIVAIIILLPFIQLGFSFYVSFMALSVVLLLPNLKLSKGVYVVLPIAFLAFFSKYVYSSFSSGDLLRDARELICFMLIFFSTYGLKNLGNVANLRATVKGIFFAVIAVLCVQAIFLANGKYFGFPIDWFVMNEGTLVGIGNALDNGVRVRPTGFYGEPSYCGFIMIILYYLLMISAVPRERIRLSLWMLLAVALSQSFSSLLIYGYLLLVFYLDKLEFKNVILIFLFIILGMFFGNSEEVARRIANFGSETDEVSSFIRFIIPVNILAISWSDGHFFGISASSLVLYFENLGYDLKTIANGFIAQLVGIGIWAFPIIGIICYRLRSYSLMVLFMLLMQVNGSVFSWDKVVLFSLLFGLQHSFKKLGNERAQFPRLHKSYPVPEAPCRHTT